MPFITGATMVGKQCDFCHRSLPKEFESKKCCRCETIFDECEECCQNPRPNPILCHKSHLTINSDLSHAENASLDAALAEPIFVAYGESYGETIRFLSSADSYTPFSDRESLQCIDMSDCNWADMGMPEIQKFVDGGRKITLTSYDGGVVLQVFETRASIMKKDNPSPLKQS